MGQARNEQLRKRFPKQMLNVLRDVRNESSSTESNPSVAQIKTEEPVFPCKAYVQVFKELDIHLYKSGPHCTLNPFLPDCKTTFSGIFFAFFIFIFKFLRPKHDCYAKFTSCSA